VAGPVISVLDIGAPSLPPVQLFNDTFDSGVLDTTVRWQQSGIGIISVIGSVTLAPTNAPGAFSQLVSQPVFKPTEPGFLVKVARINIESPVLTTAHRFWGLGTAPNTPGNSSLRLAEPTVANPIVDGMGFEIGTDGKLRAVTYQTGSKFVNVDLSFQTGSRQQPQDAAAHKYWLYFRGDIAFWAIDDQSNVVATYNTGAAGPNVNSLPILQQVVSAGGGTAATLVLNGITVSDTARTTVAVADGVNGFRKQSVSAGGAALVQVFPGAQIGMPNPGGGVDILRADGAGRLTDTNEDLLRQLIREIRVTNKLLVAGLGIDGVDLDANSDTDYD
jgi:hypothetical protein